MDQPARRAELSDDGKASGSLKELEARKVGLGAAVPGFAVFVEFVGSGITRATAYIGVLLGTGFDFFRFGFDSSGE